MELRQLQYFVAMFEEGSVTMAARRMNIVQPAISQQLSKLEAEFGQPLFHRTHKGMVPTEAGNDAYRMFLPILQNLDIAKQELSLAKGAVKGHLSVGVVASVATNLLPEALLTFNAKYPDVTIRATGGYSANLLDMLRDAQLDIAIVNAPAKIRNLDQVEILTENFALICAPDHPFAVNDQMDVREVQSHSLVTPSHRHGLREVIDSGFRQHDIRLRPRLEFDEISTIEEFVRKSGFVTILPPIAVRRAVTSGELAQVRLTPIITRTIICTTSPSRPLGKAARLFINLLREQIRENFSENPGSHHEMQ